jgi:hypothetical protein
MKIKEEVEIKKDEIRSAVLWLLSFILLPSSFFLSPL